MTSKELITIPQMIPYFDELELITVSEYMKSGGYLTEFKQTEEFERLICEFTGAKNAIVVNNGTVSLIMMLMVLNIGSGDEVIVPNYTMIATANSVVGVGAQPIFVDVEPETLCINLDEIKKVVTKKTKAIFLVSANGRFPTYGIEDLIQYCQQRNIVLLEDAAQALGSFYPDGRHIGNHGLMGSFSFSVPKIITTGQGGCIITDDIKIAEKLRRLKDFGRSQGGIDIHDSIGYNFKFTDLQAAVGIAQMSKLRQRVTRKKEIWSLYFQNLKDLSEINLFNHTLSLTSPWFIDSKVQRRDELKEYLRVKGVGTRSMYPPINSQKAYQKKGSFPVSENIGKFGLWLPSFVQISNEQVEIVCMHIKNFYSQCS